MPPRELRIISVEITNVLGIRERAIKPEGRAVLVAGANGSGKTSLIEATRAAIGGGNLARLARIGPDGEPTEPEVVIVLEGPGQDLYRVEKSGDKTAKVLHRNREGAFEDVARPQAWLNSVFDATLANPVAFLTAKDKDRALMLLEALPLKMDRDELRRAIGPAAARYLQALPDSVHPLEELALHRDAIFRGRQAINRDQDGKAKAAEQTRRNIPAVIPPDPGVAIASAEARISELSAAIARAQEAADADERQAIESAAAMLNLKREEVYGDARAREAKARRHHDQFAADVRAEAERRIAEDLAALEEAFRAGRSVDGEFLDGVEKTCAASRADANRVRQEAAVAIEAQRLGLATEREGLAALRSQADAFAAAKGQHKLAAQFEQDAEALLEESKALTAALDALDAFRRALAQDLPIQGLEIEGAVIKVNAVPYEQLNCQQRVDIGVEVAVLRTASRPLKAIFIDGFEALDTEHRGALINRLLERGIQPFCAMVADHEAAVEYLVPEEGPVATS